MWYSNNQPSNTWKWYERPNDNATVQQPAVSHRNKKRQPHLNKKKLRRACVTCLEEEARRSPPWTPQILGKKELKIQQCKFTVDITSPMNVEELLDLMVMVAYGYGR